MIILDTNVISEIIRADSDPNVVDWLNTQSLNTVWTTSIATMELRNGVELVTSIGRRADLERRIEAFFAQFLPGRIAPFDAPAAEVAGALMARRRRQGQTVDIRDTQIAGIAVSRGATLATRNTKHFADLPIPIVDPWNRPA